MKRLQNRIAESRTALPFAAAWSLLVCVADGLFRQGLWVQTALLAVSALLMVLLNNSNALIRIYSRMVSCSFLVLSTMVTFLLPSVEGAVAGLSLIGFYLIIYRAYQDNAAPGTVFYAFLCIGAGSMVFVQLLYFVPVLWLLLAAMVLAFSLRNFLASILGLVLPYWFAVCWYAYSGTMDRLLSHFAQLGEFGPLCDFSRLGLHQLVSYGFIVLLAVVGTVHFLRTSYNDKIRTRMIFEGFIAVDFFAVLFLVLQPQWHDALIHIIIVSSAPLIGHFIALTKTRFTNVVFVVMGAAALVLTLWNLWMSSPLF